MKKKVPVNQFGSGNCCPECGSTKISAFYQYPMIVEEDLNTGNEIFRDEQGKRIYNVTNKLLAHRYKSAQFVGAESCTYKCRKCGWISETYTLM